MLDFANTVAWRLDPARTVDRVRGVEAWARWAVAAGLLSADRAEALLRAEVADSTPSTGATAGLLDLRAALWPVLDALVEDEEPPAAEWEALRLGAWCWRARMPYCPPLFLCGGGPARTVSTICAMCWRCGRRTC